VKHRPAIAVAACILGFFALAGCTVAPSADIDFSSITAIFRVIQDLEQEEGTAFAQFSIGGDIPTIVFELTQGETIEANGIRLIRSANIADFLGPVYTGLVPRQDPPEGEITFIFVDRDGKVFENGGIPAEPIEITSPLDGAQLPLSQGLQIDWAAAASVGEGDVVRIEVEGPDATDPSSAISMSPIELTDDPGTFLINDLSELGAGEGWIRLDRIREVPVTEGFKDGTLSVIQRHEVLVTFIEG